MQTSGIAPYPGRWETPSGPVVAWAALSFYTFGCEGRDGRRPLDLTRYPSLG